MRLREFILLSQLSFIFSIHAVADTLDNLPEKRQQELALVQQVDISTLKPIEQTAIREARSKVATLISAKADAKQLATAYGKLGNLYLTHDMYTSADACYRNAMQLAPGHFPWVYYSAYLAQKNGNMQDALPRLKQALEIDPAYQPASYRLAQVYLDLNRLDKAYTLFNSLLDNEEFRAAAHNGLGHIFLARQDYTNAANHFTQALELAPEATSIHYPLAMSFRGTGQQQLAKQHLQQLGKEEIIIKDPLVDALEALKDPANRHFVNAMSSVLKKEYGKAVEEFESGFQYNPDNRAARTSYARVLYLNNEKARSREQLNRVIAEDPEYTLALFLLAVLDDEEKLHQEAVKLYRRVIELDPAHEGANFFLGNHYLHNHDYSNAVRHYKAATEINENNIPARVFMLVAMMGNNDPDRETLSAAMEITDRISTMLAIKRIEILLLALSKDANIKNSELAKKKKKKTYNSQPHPVNLELLAIANASSGDFDLAVEQMSKAVSAEQQYKHSRNIKRMQSSLALLQNKELPALNWHDEVAHMQPPAIQALATFRDYPDANPI